MNDEMSDKNQRARMRVVEFIEKSGFDVNNFSLMESQIDGVHWMFRQKTGGILAHQMGKGKTLQALLMIAVCKQQSIERGIRSKCSLVVGPSTVMSCSDSKLSEWVQQVFKFFPGVEGSTDSSMTVGVYNNTTLRIYSKSHDSPISCNTISLKNQKSGPTLQQINQCDIMFVHYDVISTIRNRLGIKEIENDMMKITNKYCIRDPQGLYKMKNPASILRGTTWNTARGQKLILDNLKAILRRQHPNVPDWLVFPKKRNFYHRSSYDEGGPGLFTYPWRHIFLDEGHKIKNLKKPTQYALGLFSMRASRNWVLTGTPVYHSDNDLHPLFAFVRAKRMIEPKIVMRDLNKLNSMNIESKIKNQRARQGDLVYLLREIQALINSGAYKGTELSCLHTYKWYAATSHEYIHRLKPPKEKGETPLQLSNRIFNSRSPEGYDWEHLKHRANDSLPSLWLRVQSIPKLDTKEEETLYMDCCDMERFKSTNEKNGKGELSYNSALTMLLRARQVITDPYLLPEDFIRTSLKLKKEEAIPHLNSTKVSFLVKYVKDERVVKKDERVLVFCEWKLPLIRAQKELKNVGIDSLYICGEMKNSEKRDIVKKCEENENIKVLLSTYVLETGVNLQHLFNHVVILSRRWTQNSMEQAIGRCFRKGQKKDVRVMYVDMKNRVDENVKKINENKGSIQMLVGNVGSFKPKAKEIRRIAMEINNERLADSTSNVQSVDLASLVPIHRKRKRDFIRKRRLNYENRRIPEEFDQTFFRKVRASEENQRVKVRPKPRPKQKSMYHVSLKNNDYEMMLARHNRKLKRIFPGLDIPDSDL